MSKLPKYATIGTRIRHIRAKLGLSQTKFAQNIGIAQRTLSDIEKGITKPSGPILLAIEYVYRFRKEWILYGEEPVYVDELNPPPIIPLTGTYASQRQLMYWINKLIRIFEEGDKGKIEAIKAQLRALDPLEKKQHGDTSKNARAGVKNNNT